MSTLHVAPVFHDDELFSNYVSRVAAANGARSAVEFCQDMGLRFQSLVDGDGPSVNRMLELTRQEHRANAVGIARREDRTLTFGSETLLRSNLSRHRLRVCPHCLDEDEASDCGYLGARAYGRLAWLPAFVRTCRTHGSMLVPLPEAAGFGSVHDFSARLELARPTWRRYVQASASAESSDFELYVENRLHGREREAIWLDRLPLYAAGRLTEIVGATITHGRDFVTASLGERDWLDAGRRGFEVTSQGPTVFQEFLRTLHDKFRDRQGDFGGRLIYGRLYEMLAHENEDVVYDPIRDLIRETAVSSLPIGPDHRLFGVSSPRRWHSVRSVTKEFGLHHKTARKMLVAADLIDPDTNTDDSRTLVEAGEMETFVRRWQSSLKTDAAREYVNISRSSWEIVLKEGYVKPLIENYRQQGVAPLFPLDELDRFVARLEAVAPVGTTSNSDFVSLPSAAKRASVRLAQILQLLFDGGLKSAFTEAGVCGFGSVRVSVPETILALQSRFRDPWYL
ncbi:hypothetical protein GOL75_14365 [Sinorhizobium medicae]|nr:hypothetical protein [Sinorhizobium medicae]MDX1162501.1 hypothetical protein [Sinorhizobium medicae]